MPESFSLARKKASLRSSLLHVAILVLGGCDFIGHDPSAAMPTLFAPADTAITKRFGVGRVEVPTAALRANDPPIGVFLLLLAHRFRFLCISAKLILPDFGIPTESLPERATPCIDAPTQQPTMQSSQWLSPRSGRCFHSSTVRPRPSVRTRYSAQRCSARSLWVSGLAPKRDKQPLLPIETARRACIKVFQ
jgi:hypothetical protein